MKSLPRKTSKIICEENVLKTETGGLVSKHQGERVIIG